MKCNYEKCNLNYEIDVEADWGSYHEECRDAELADEQKYWAGIYRRETRFPVFNGADELLAYDRGTAKRYDLEQRWRRCEQAT